MTPKRKRPTISITLEPDVLETVKAVSEQLNISVSVLINLALRTRFQVRFPLPEGIDRDNFEEVNPAVLESDGKLSQLCEAFDAIGNSISPEGKLISSEKLHTALFTLHQLKTIKL
ncbi:MAG: hypothetical protein JEZ11_22005 [Desulfobacterales bacterium]|nr:hypothetical protein [Desulfobacterales bacterium]